MKGSLILKITFLIVMMAGGLCQRVVSQDDGRALLYFISKDSTDNELLGYFYRTQSPMFSDPSTPRFIVASRNRNFIMGIGGYIMLRGFYDFNGISDGRYFQTKNIPIPNAGNPRSQLSLDVSSSRIFTKIIGNTKSLGQLEGYVEGDFLGASRTFRLRQAYLKFLGFTFGQTLSTFMDAKCIAPHVDQYGSIVNSTQRNPMIRYERELGKGFGFGLAAEFPPFSGTYSATTASAYPFFPDIPLYLEYKWKTGHLKLAALFRDLPYKSLENNTYHGLFGIGGKASGKIRLFDPLTFYFHTAYGKGISSYFLDLASEGLDLLPDPDRPGRMSAPKAFELYTALRFNFSKTVYSSANFGYCRIYPNKSYVNSDLFKPAAFYSYGQSVGANIIWEFISSASCGLEYFWGKKTVYNGENGHANRIYGMIRYNF